MISKKTAFLITKKKAIAIAMKKTIHMTEGTYFENTSFSWICVDNVNLFCVIRVYEEPNLT
jgi:hypothetical protein